MAVRVALNGFGRIGRCVLRAAWGNPEVEFVHINDLTSPDMLAHLLKFDSVHGRFAPEVKAVPGGISVGGRLIPVTAEKDPSKLPWAAEGVDVVMECTGIFRKRSQAAVHLNAGAKRVIISAPAKDEDYTVVMGVNDAGLRPEHRVLSNASCTTNCLAPFAKVLDDSFGIQSGLMTTIHSYTMDQRLLDAPHDDMRRARAAAVNMVPTSTGAASAVGLVLPQLNGKLNGLAIRVPTANVSLVDLVFQSERPLSVAAINEALIAAANGPMKGILAASDLPLVSSDLIGDAHSSTVDLALTQVMGSHTGKVLAWYDNEWGFSNRMIDLAIRLGGMEVA
ncbi:MAG: type I glyceraldehyde-3-phosphate dehydrogenase [Deltaproteobacteria bacterium]|jgi:glyceraldehyde 3-phosphate dehydrogenase|nr:type I glyceraldehyde-3-phosphate dehydrogenase [Deltaproteobacteria bacterium]